MFRGEQYNGIWVQWITISVSRVERAGVMNRVKNDVWSTLNTGSLGIQSLRIGATSVSATSVITDSALRVKYELYASLVNDTVKIVSKKGIHTVKLKIKI